MRFHAFLVVLLISRTCDNSLENHGRNEHHIFFIFASMKFFWWRWKMLFSHCVLQCFMFFTWRYYTPPPPHPPSVNNNETFNVTPSSNQATSSRIQHHPTHFTLRYYTTPTPPSINNIETCNVTPSSNQATSSRIQHHPTHFTWRYYNPPRPPPSVYKNELSGIASRLRVPRSSGEPPALSLYIIIYIWVCGCVCSTHQNSTQRPINCQQG